MLAQVVMESPVSGIVADTQLIGVNRFVQLASRLCSSIAAISSRSYSETRSIKRKACFAVFPAARHVPGIVERDAKEVVSHREIRIDCGGALKQRNSGQKMALAHLGKTRGVVLKSFQRRSGGLFQRTIQLLDRVERFSQLAAHGRRRGSHCVQHVLFIFGLDLLPGERCAVLAGDCLERDDVASYPGSRSCRRWWPRLLRGRRFRARSGLVMRAPGGRLIRRRTRCTCSSSIILRNGDCSSWIARPWRSVPSKTGSPVLLTKSARTIVSLSVSFGARWK